LRGLGVREKRPLRIDLAFHESPQKELPLQSANCFFSSNDFHIDLNYCSLLPSNDSRIILDYHRIYFIV
jgi:hypothetical protein